MSDEVHGVYLFIWQDRLELFNVMNDRYAILQSLYQVVFHSRSTCFLRTCQ